MSFTATSSAVHPHAVASLSELATVDLDDQGVIQDCNRTCEQVLGYPRTELLGCHVSLLVPKLGNIELIKQNRIDPYLAYLCHCAIPFRARRRDGNSFPSHLFVNRLNSHKPGLRMIIRGLQGVTP